MEAEKPLTEEELKAKEILETIGFNKNEILIYLDLIKNSQSSALEISKRTKIYRSNVYDSLRKLREKGFVEEVISEDKKLFNAMDPKKIKDYMHQKEKELDLILPELRSLSTKNDEENEFNISQGKFAAREALLDLLEYKKTIYAYGASKEAVESFGEGFLEDFHRRRMHKKIQMNHIYNKSAIKRINVLNKLDLTEARYLPEKYSTTTATVICGDIVLLLVFSKPLLIIRIKNPNVAKTYQNYFDLLWKNAKSVKKAKLI